VASSSSQHASLQNTIALVYDYDQTLSPYYMQDDVIFPAFGINAEKFWERCADLVQAQGYDNELAYMKCLLDYLAMDRPTNQQLKQLGAKMRLYKGLPEMFEEFNLDLLEEHHLAAGIHVDHFVVSSGLKVLIEGSQLRPYVREIFGCEYAEDSEGKITFPKRVISHTQKTQYLFRINKGLLDMGQDVNDHMPDEARPVPFPNMIYIGDGPTDVHCFTIMRKNGGHAIAVYNPDDPSRASFKKCFSLSAHADRVRHIAPSDYRRGSHLRLLLEEIVREIADRILTSRKSAGVAGLVRAPQHRP
jgi:haloacid dehalogenase-like hydrolase